MRLVDAEQALAQIGPGRRLVASPGCGAPTTLLRAIGEHPEAIEGSHLYSGMLLGDYPFADAVRAGTIRYGTWHVMAPVRDLVRDGTVAYFPVRGSQVPRLIERLGIDVALVRVSPPDRHGYCSLGPSVSYVLGAIRHARLVVAELDDDVPRVHGEGNVHVSELDVCVAATEPAAEYRRAEPDDVSRAIAHNIIGLLPQEPVLQIGIGSIPEALIDELIAQRIGGVRFVGMAVDGIVDLHDAGLLAREPLWPHPPVLAAELMGTRRLMDFADGNPAVGVYSTAVGIDARALSRVDGLV
jgi:4-hydroxybutyrate CoA-transferase